MKPHIRCTIGWLACAVGVFMVSPQVQAQDAVDRPYDAIAAAHDAHHHAEIRRRQMLARQLETIDWLDWWSGRPSGRFAGAVHWPASRNELYAFSVDAADYPPYAFTPWPVVPGDIWGYPDRTFVRQPIGQRQVQIGPRRWESHPVFAEPAIAPAPQESALPRSGPREF